MSSGVKKRIAEKPAVFEALTPQQQKTLQAGFIENDFTKDMVYIALGNPSRTTSEDSPMEEVTIWIYNYYYSNTTGPTTIEPSNSAQSTLTSPSALTAPHEANRSTDHVRQVGLNIDDLPVDTLYVVFIDDVVFGMSLESQGGPIKLFQDLDGN
tara:strand:+ start:462 stop:923 length:462 start_codon:yes stop_codon:yes gene_type:complete